MLECDCSGHEYTNVDHDITLRIPEGAVAEGEKIHFEVAVTMYGPFIFPENTQPISPILWLCLLEEDAKLRKPLEIVLPHFLTGNIHQYNISFMKANHNDYKMNDSCQMFYNFKLLFSDTALVYRESQGYGVTITDHLCYLCLAAQQNIEKIKENANYCLARVELQNFRSLQEITFCACYFLPTCIEVQQSSSTIIQYIITLHHLHACLQALEDQYPPSAMEFSKPFKLKEPQESLRIIVERYTDNYIIAMEPSAAEVHIGHLYHQALCSLLHP